MEEHVSTYRVVHSFNSCRRFFSRRVVVLLGIAMRSLLPKAEVHTWFALGHDGGRLPSFVLQCIVRASRGIADYSNCLPEQLSQSNSPRASAWKGEKANPRDSPSSWDDWVPQDRVRKFTEENKQLASQLHEQMKALQGKPSSTKSAKPKGRIAGSDFSSARGSEERSSMAAPGGGRGPRRGRDFDLEQVCASLSFFGVLALR